MESSKGLVDVVHELVQEERKRKEEEDRNAPSVEPRNNIESQKSLFSMDRFILGDHIEIQKVSEGSIAVGTP